MTFYLLKNDVNVRHLQKVISKKVSKFFLFLVGISKITDKKSRIRSRIWFRQPEIRDPQIRIRTKMSRIRNTAFLCSCIECFFSFTGT